MPRLRVALLLLGPVVFIHISAKAQVSCSSLVGVTGNEGFEPGTSHSVPCRRTSSSASSAQEKVDQINRNNAAGQQALKEGMDRLKELLTSHPSSEAETEPDSEPVGSPYVSDEPYVSDVKDKYLPPDPVDLEARAAERAERQRQRDADDLLRQARELLQLAATDCNALRSTYSSGRPTALPAECVTALDRATTYSPGGVAQPGPATTDCIALKSTYYSGPPPALPPECLTDLDRATTYIPGRSSQAQLPGAEPVIDGSQIPSAIDFTSPSLERLSDEIAPRPKQIGLDGNPIPNEINFSKTSPSLERLSDEIGSSPEQIGLDGKPIPKQIDFTRTSPALHELSNETAPQPSPTPSPVPSPSDTSLPSGTPGSSTQSSPLPQPTPAPATAPGRDPFSRIYDDGNGASSAPKTTPQPRPVPSEDGSASSTTVEQDQADMDRAQSLGSLWWKGVYRYGADLQEKVGKIIDQILAP